MDPLALFLSSSGRIGPRTFVIAVILVYVAGFASQALLGGPVIARAGLAPFALTQAALTWAWYALHAKRLHDANLGTGGAFGIAILYALAIVLLLLVVAFFANIGTRDAAGNDSPASNVFGFVVVLYLFALLFSSADLGFFTVLITCAIVVALSPALIAVTYTAYVALRPRAAPVAPPTQPVPSAPG